MTTFGHENGDLGWEDLSLFPRLVELGYLLLTQVLLMALRPEDLWQVAWRWLVSGMKALSRGADWILALELMLLQSSALRTLRTVATQEESGGLTPSPTALTGIALRWMD